MKDIDLLLVNPGNRLEQFAGLNELATVAQPLGIAMIAAYARQYGYSVAIVDAEAEFWTPEEAIQEIAQYNPLLIGLSAFTTKMTSAGRILGLIRERMPKAFAVIGGHHVSAIPERTMIDEQVDFVVKGEGFYPVVELLRRLKNRIRDLDIQGVWYKWDGEVVGNGRAEGIKNLDSLPFAAWDLLPMNKYRAHHWQAWGHDVNDLSGFAVIYTSLGCPFNCVVRGTEIYTDVIKGGNRKTIESLVTDSGANIKGFKDNKIERARVLAGKAQTVNELMELTLSDGRTLAVTPEHLVYTKRGWVEAQSINEDDEVLVCGVSSKRTLRPCPVCDKVSEMRPSQTYCSLSCNAKAKDRSYEMGDNNVSKRPEVKEKIRLSKRGNKNPMKRPEVAAKVSASLRLNHHKALSKMMREKWASGKITGHPMSDEVKHLNSERMKKDNPMFNPEVAKKVGKRHSFLIHNNPEYRDRLLKSRNRHPNNAEQRFIKIIKWHHLPFRFTGDGSFWIGPCQSGKCRNPDFMGANGKKKALLLHGRYFHQDEEKNATELADYKDKGYDVLVVWDDELKRNNRIKLAEKVRCFYESTSAVVESIKS